MRKLHRHHRFRQRRLNVEPLEARQLLTAASGVLPHTSPSNLDDSVPLDVDCDGIISSSDALIVINELNGGPWQGFDTDVNRDNVTSPIDALMILNRLNVLSHSRNADTLESESGFQTAANDAQAVTFAVIGDYGLPGENASGVAAMVNARNPDFIVGVGDGRYLETSYDDVTGLYCDFLVDVQPGTNCPTGGNSSENRFFAAPGNHDYSDGGGIEQYLDYFSLPGAGATSPNPTGSELYFDVVKGPVHLFVLDSQAIHDSVASRRSQSAWLQAGLQASQSPWQIVVVHHTPFSSSRRGTDEIVSSVPFADWGVDLVLGAHDHTYERIERDGTTFTVNGLSGAWVYSFENVTEGSVFQFNERHGAAFFEATATTLTGLFRTMDGDVVDPFTVEANAYTGAPDPFESLFVAADADYNGDCVIGRDDYLLWQSTYNSTTNLAADGNGNGVVDAGDFTIWRDRAGQSICN